MEDLQYALRKLTNTLLALENGDGSHGQTLDFLRKEISKINDAIIAKRGE